MAVIRPLSPGREERHVQPDLLQEGCSVDRVESVAEVDFQDDFGSVAGIAEGPMPDSVDGGLAPKRHSNPNLEGRQGGAGLLLVGLAEALAHETPQGFSNSDGPHRKEGGPCEVGRQLGRALSRGEKPDHISEVVCDLIGVRGAEGFTEVVAAQAWACRLALRVLGAQLVEDTRLVAQQSGAEQGGTGTGQLALSAKSSAAGLAGRNLAVLVLRVLEGGRASGVPRAPPAPPPANDDSGGERFGRPRRGVWSLHGGQHEQDGDAALTHLAYVGTGGYWLLGEGLVGGGSSCGRQHRHTGSPGQGRRHEGWERCG
ncbi:unnamed protein product, partial [Symbiodinium sp. CCMP2456]